MAIIAIYEVLLATTEGKVSSHVQSFRDTVVKKHVHTQVHVVMSVDARGRFSQKPGELVPLCPENVIKCLAQEGVEQNLTRFPSLEVGGDPLMLPAQLP